MKIVLIHPPWSDLYGKYKAAAKVGNCYPPLGLCYLAAMIKNKGHICRIIDAEFESLSVDEVVRRVLEFSPDLVGITSTTPIFHHAKSLANSIKKSRDIPIVIGGPHVTVMPVETMENKEFDYGIYGEGEETFVQLVDALSENRSCDSINGLLYRKDGKIIKTQPRKFIDNLDQLPFPDRTLLKLDKYLWSVPKKGIVKFTTIMTSRGCPFQCIFCSERTMFGTTVRFRTPENVIAEIEHMVKDLGIKHFAFIDDTLTLNRDRVIKICNGIIERNLDVTWEGWTRANTVDEDLLRLMKKAGFVRVSFGIESGNEDILKIIKKGVNLEELKTAYKLAKRVGLETRGSVMIGHPFETEKTLKDTINYIKKLKYCDQIFLNITTPYPGTELYEMALNGTGGLRLLTTDFSEYTRYGNSVIEVNGLNRSDLIRWQKKGFLAFYLKPRRILYNFKRAGLKAGIKNSLAFMKSMWGK